MATIREKKAAGKKKQIAKQKVNKENEAYAGDKGPDEKTFNALVDYISLGLDVESACRLSGYSYSKFEYHKRKRTKFGQLMEAAEDKREEVYLVPIRNAAMNGDWRAAAWALEKLYPKKYSGTVSRDIGINKGSQKIRTKQAKEAKMNKRT